jgi:hypothetical protein
MTSRSYYACRCAQNVCCLIEPAKTMNIGIHGMKMNPKSHKILQFLQLQQ